MKNYQNQLDRFRDIAKKLVDDHSTELFTRTHVTSNGTHNVLNDAYYNHLDVLGRQLDEQAQQFISARKNNEHLKSDIWNTCKKYLDLFVKRNEPKG
jgi:BMFP domain-containing protein YqiC